MALLGSLLINFVLVLLVTALYLSELVELQKLPEVKWVMSPEFFKVKRGSDKDQEKAEEKEKLAQIEERQKEEEEKKPGFMNTVKEQEAKEAPKDPVYIGARNTKLASERESSPDGLEFLPSTEGEKKKPEEMVSLIDQRARMGDLDTDVDINPGEIPQVVIGRHGTQIAEPMPPTPPGEPTPPIPPAENTGEAPTDPVLPTVDGLENPQEGDKGVNEQGVADGIAGESKDGKSADDYKEPDQVAEESTGDLNVRPNDEAEENERQDSPHAAETEESRKLKELLQAELLMKLPDHLKPKAAAPLHGGAASDKEKGINLPQLTENRPVYDPVMQNGGRPGYRGESRKNRVTGQMSTRGMVAADVQATEMGLYVSMFFRALNRNWDMECTRNRDMIIPGSMKIRFVINRNGSAGSIRLINKEAGSRAVQQAFTFRAISMTRIGPMPPGVIKEAGEDKIEILVDFLF